MRPFLIAAACLCALSCAEPETFFAADLSTDYVAGVDFSTVHLFLSPVGESERVVRTHDAEPRDYTRPSRIVTIEDLPAGVYVADVQLLDQDEQLVAARSFRFQSSGSYVLPVRIDTRCRAVECPTAGDLAATECLAGECVPPTCIHPEDCGVADCEEDADCEASPVACRTGVCVDGLCGFAEVESACDDDEYCDLVLSCTPREEGPALRPIGPRSVDATPLENGTIFASPDGTGAECTEADPCDLWTASARAMAGDVVFMRGGNYRVVRDLTFEGRGMSPAPAVFESYPGEVAVLEGTNVQGDRVYLTVTGDALVLRRFEVREMPQVAINLISGNHVLEGLIVQDNLRSGIVIASDNNLVTDCIVSRNQTDGAESDGFVVALASDNRIENCLIEGSPDEGIDMLAESARTYVGYSIVRDIHGTSGTGTGIATGGSGHHVEHCLLYRNNGPGLISSSGADLRFNNNTAWNNGGAGFYGWTGTVIENSIARNNEMPFDGAASPENCSWQRAGQVEFISTDPDAEGFLDVPSGSDFEDIGAYANRE